MFYGDDLFKTTSETLEQLYDENEVIISDELKKTRAAENQSICQYQGYPLKGDLDSAMEINLAEFKTFVSSLIEALNISLEPLLEIDISKLMGIILDYESFKFLDIDIIYDISVNCERLQWCPPQSRVRNTLGSHCSIRIQLIARKMFA